MTFVVGWKTSDATFIAADSMIKTKNRQAPNDISISSYSSFGEKHIIREVEDIQEGALKLFQVNPSITIGFAGNLENATKCIEYFCREVALIQNSISKESLGRSLKFAIGMCGANLRGDERFELIISAYAEAHPILLSYNENGNNVVTEHEKFVCIGTGRESTVLMSVIQYVYDMINARRSDYVKRLVLLQSILQTAVYHEKLLKNTLGGFIAANAVSLHGTQWQPDTSFILYKHEYPFPEMSMILLGVRDGVVGVSSIFRERSYFATPTSFPIQVDDRAQAMKAWWVKYKDEFGKIFLDVAVDYWVFMSQKHRLITIVSKEKSVDIIKTQINAGGRMDQWIAPVLARKLLLEPPPDRAGVPFYLNLMW